MIFRKITKIAAVSCDISNVKCETGNIGTIENAGVENAGLELSAPNCRGWKLQDWNFRHHITGGGKCGTGIIGTKLQGVENTGPSSYGKPKHVVVAAHRKSSVQLLVGINNVAYA